MSDESVTRAQMELSKSSWLRLMERAEKDGISVSAAGRRAVWLYTMVRDRQDRGDRLLIEPAAGPLEIISLEPEASADAR